MTPLRIVLTALAPFAAGYFLSYLLRAVNAVVAPDLVADAGLSPAELGLLTAAYLGAFALFQLPLGVLSTATARRAGRACCAWRAGCLGCRSPGFIGLFSARALIGLGFSAGLMASYKSSATWVPSERRSLANTAIMSVGALGVVVATEPTEFLVGLIGWRATFAVFAGLILAAALLILAEAPRQDTVGAPLLPPPVRRLMAIVRLFGALHRFSASPPASRSAFRHFGPAPGSAMSWGSRATRWRGISCGWRFPSWPAYCRWA
jgi:MFS family permease